ncbi:hypothetical protein AB0I81_54280 [Nonomuraea sp. NPDC050404]|uniref:hypothetical protein n=1 Tax=Nonomuraea sp. NPDC050404 TaxID=3155783 RepID=UPI0033E4DAD1
MKHRGTVILLVLLAAAVAVTSVGLVQAADSGPDLGEAIMVSPSPLASPGRASASETLRTGESKPTQSGESDPTRPGESPSVGSSPSPSADRSPSERPTARKTKAEPVKPLSPRPGGGDDDDDDDGGDDDGDD